MDGASLTMQSFGGGTVAKVRATALGPCTSKSTVADATQAAYNVDSSLVKNLVLLDPWWYVQTLGCPAMLQCIAVVVLTFRRSSDIHFVKPGESRVVKGLGWTALTLLLGWWGIPWGPIWTIGSLWKNLQGGEDVTAQVMNSLGTSRGAAAGGPPPMPPQAPPLPGSY